MSVKVDVSDSCKVVSDKFKHSDEGFKYFIIYQEDKIVKPLCIFTHFLNEWMHQIL